MTIQHLNDVKTIARTATALGAVLPEEITGALAHLEDITRNAPDPVRPGLLARELADHIGDPAAMDKALKAAASKLAASDAAGKIHTYLAETCGARIRGMMRAHAEQVATAFGEALQRDLDALRETAGLLPDWFSEAQAASLDPATFTAWTRARDAYLRIQSAQVALAPLYSGAIPSAHAGQFPRTAAASLVFAAPPVFDTAREAYAFRDALAGRTERVQGLAGQGSTFIDGLFVPTLLEHADATFEWATPAQVTKRADEIVAAMVDRDRVPA